MARNTVAMQAKAKTHKVTQQAAGYYHVTSGHSGTTYHVRLQGGAEFGATCSCAWGGYRGEGQRSACSHVLSVMSVLAEHKGRRVSAWGSLQDAQRQRRRMVGIGDDVTLTVRKG